MCKEIRQHPSGHNIPFLLLTGSDGSNLETDAKEAGITQIFYKSNLGALADYITEFKKTSRMTEALTGMALLVEDSPIMANFGQNITRHEPYGDDTGERRRRF